MSHSVSIENREVADDVEAARVVTRLAALELVSMPAGSSRTCIPVAAERAWRRNFCPLQVTEPRRFEETAWKKSFPSRARP
jgi:hypothetical protein